MKTILGVLIGCAALLVIAYGIGVFYYSGHFLSGTEINGVDCSGKTVAEAEESIESQIASYQLVLKEREDKSETISASQINMEYISDGGVQELKNQQNQFCGSRGSGSEGDSPPVSDVGSCVSAALSRSRSSRAV